VAAGEGKVEATELLLDAGAPLDARGDLGGTALHHAAWNGRGGTVDLLLRRGADPLALAPEPAAGTPLHWAVHGSRNAEPNGGAYFGIGRRLVAAGGVPDSEMADYAVGPLAALLAGEQSQPAPAPLPGRPDWGEVAARVETTRLRSLAGSPAAESRPVGDGLAVRTGVLDNTLNGVVCDVCTEAEIAEAIAWLGGLPAYWLTGPGSPLAPGAPDDGAVVMGAAAHEVVRGAAPGIGIAPVATAGDLDAWLGLQELDGPRDRAARRRVLAALPDGFALLLARAAGEAVGAIATFRDADALLVEHLDVAEHAQGSGIGRALVTAALDAERGVQVVIAGPTPSSQGFWERMGLELQRAAAGRAFHLPAVAS
jgi:GNAT superfamily N-acetyltransferase